MMAQAAGAFLPAARAIPIGREAGCQEVVTTVMGGVTTD